MKKQISTAIISRTPKHSYSPMYSMHKYWSKKSSDIINAYIENYSNKGEVILDPFCGSGITVCEAVRLGRKAIAIDINPVATFITRMVLTPINLSRMEWAFIDIMEKCKKSIYDLFITKCEICHKDAIIEFVIRENNIPIKIAYKCNCSKERRFKEPSQKDIDADKLIKHKRIPYWYPYNIALPVIQKEKYKFVHELFTKRNLIALSIINNTIEQIQDSKIRDFMKLAFSASLDKCSRLKPLSKIGKTPSLSEGWVAVRFYTPEKWIEVNPWDAFERSFKRVYKGKKESNNELKNAIIGTSFKELAKGEANVVILDGSAENVLKEIPKEYVHYILTDPPFGDQIQYLALSTFYGAWLRFSFDYNNELIVNRYRNKMLQDYEQHFEKILKSMKEVIKTNRYINIFYQDISGPYLHKLLRLMSKYNILPEKVVHQPPANSFGAAVMNKNSNKGGHYGSYIVRGKKLKNKIIYSNSLTKKNILKKKIIRTVRTSLQIRKEGTSIGTLLHSIYQNLSGKDILLFEQYSKPENYLKESIKEFAVINKDIITLKKKRNPSNIQTINSRIKNALLDAKSLYKDQQNQVYQSVLRRFQKEGIIIDDVYLIENDLSEEEINQYRIDRLANILYIFGEELNYKSSIISNHDKKVIWKSEDGLICVFLLTNKGIHVEASQSINKNKITSKLGVIYNFELFEQVLWKWCQNNKKKRKALLKIINPIDKVYKPPILPKHILLKVLKNRKLCLGHFLITLQIPKHVDLDIVPGQFFHIICDPNRKTIKDNINKERNYPLTLRRPFGAHRLHYKEFDHRLLAASNILPYTIRNIVERPLTKIDILYKVIGKGTSSLSKIPIGSYLDVLGPLGNGFDIKQTNSAIIVAGGIGVAPLVALAERLRYLGIEVYMYLGAVNHIQLSSVLRDSTVQQSYLNGTEFCELIIKEFKEIGAKEVKIRTDDEIAGEKGFVTDILKRDIELGDIPKDNISIFACGPYSMLKAVFSISCKYNIKCQVLLEERMACGIGACYSCTCFTKGKKGEITKKRVCKDGPVFNAKDIVWTN